jgi:hypothetical protein
MTLTALRDTGAVVFQNCAGCHGDVGQGGRGPALANSDFFMNNRQIVINLVLRGNQEDPLYIDSLVVNGVTYQGGGMPAQAGYYTDRQLAAVLTYLRSVLNDSLVLSCDPNTLDENFMPTCVKQERTQAAMDLDIVAPWEVKAVRDSLGLPPPEL